MREDEGPSLGALLTTARARRGNPSQAEMAAEMRATQHQVGRWLRDIAFPAPEARPAVAEWVEITLDELEALNPKPAAKGRPRRSTKRDVDELRGLVGRLAARVEELAIRVADLDDAPRAD